jgi:hypothetical protein
MKLYFEMQIKGQLWGIGEANNSQIFFSLLLAKRLMLC